MMISCKRKRSRRNAGSVGDRRRRPPNRLRSPQRKRKSPSRRQEEALDRVVQIVTSLDDDYQPLWSSLVKQTLRRVEPGFNEKRFGFKNFNDLLETAAKAGYVTLELDPARGNHKVRLKS